jgi:hypothetical protein
MNSNRYLINRPTSSPFAYAAYSRYKTFGFITNLSHHAIGLTATRLAISEQTCIVAFECAVDNMLAQVLVNLQRIQMKWQLIARIYSVASTKAYLVLRCIVRVCGVDAPIRVIVRIGFGFFSHITPNIGHHQTHTIIDLFWLKKIAASILFRFETTT